MSTIVPPAELTKLSNTERAKVLDELFEPCSEFTDYVLPYVFNDGQIYHSYTSLIEKVRSVLSDLANHYKTSPTAAERFTIDAIVSTHPRLGVPKTTKLSAHSAAEQKSLSGDPELAKKLADLNAKYEKTFPGLRYVVFVNGRSRDVIMENMKSRIARDDWQMEVEEAFNAMCDIALDRASKCGAKL